MKSHPFRVLFVCMGNICRSPAAEIVFTHLVHEAGLADRIEADSAGTIGYHAGHEPDRRMAATLKQRGYPIHGAARQIQRRDLDRFDLILVADQDNLSDVRSLDPNGDTHPKIHLLTRYCTALEADHVPDPYYGGQSGFDRVADIVEDACKGLLLEIARALPPV